jgi:hypothetical protein
VLPGEQFLYQAVIVDRIGRVWTRVVYAADEKDAEERASQTLKEGERLSRIFHGYKPA